MPSASKRDVAKATRERMLQGQLRHSVRECPVMSSIEPANVQLQIVNSRALFLCHISTAAQSSVRRAHRKPSIQSRHRG